MVQICKLFADSQVEDIVESSNTGGVYIGG